jgi:hypothetical protein
MGELVFKNYGEKIVVTRKPDMSRVVWSEAQQQARSRFKQAAAYARQAMNDPVLKARYAAAGKEHGSPTYRVALADAFHPPTIDKVDLTQYHGCRGDRIVVWAHDDFEVTRVQVAIVQFDGAAIEEGNASPETDGRWVYTTCVSLPEGTALQVTITVSDRAGNKVISIEPG